MPAITEADLKKQIKAQNFSNLYFFYGEEKYLVKHYTDLLVKKLVQPDFADFNLHIYDGKNADFDEILNAREGLPMLSEYLCIMIKDLPVDSLNTETAEKLENLVSDIPETTIIIISLLTAEDSLKSAKGKKTLLTLNNSGTTVEFTKASLSQLEKLIEKGAQARGCECAYKEASYLISVVGDDMTVILNELEKICAYKKEGKIEKSDIDAVTVKNLQARVFDLTKALSAGNCDGAMAVLDTLMAMKEEPVNILAVMMTNYIDMYRASVYSAGGLRAEDAAKDFNYKNKEFRLRNAAKYASVYSVRQLRDFLEILNDADMKLKGIPVSGRLVLEETITRLLLASNGEKV